MSFLRFLNFHTNSYIAATVHHTNPFITLGWPVLTSNTNRSHQIQIVTSIGQRLSQWMLSPVFTRSSTIPPFCTIVVWLDTSSLIWSILANMYCTNCGSDVGNCKFCRTCGKGKRNVEHVLFYVRVLLGATTECRGPLVSQSFEERSITQ